MKNIAIITQSLNSGGAERMAANLSLLLEEEYNVILISFSDKNINYNYGGKLVSYKFKFNKSNPISHFLSIILRIIETNQIKKKFKIDVTISHQDRPNLYNVLSGIHDKKICCLHTSPINVMKKNSLRCIGQRIACRLSNYYIAVSRVAENDLNSVFGFPSDKVKCVYNFCDVEYIKSRINDNICNEHIKFILEHEFNIVYSARLIESKGHNHLFKVLKTLLNDNINIGLILLGDGKLRSNLYNLSIEMEINEHILFCGYVENPFCYIAKADLFVMPSEYEGLPMVLIEAAACGCPIISTDIVSGPREILAPNTDIQYQTKSIEYAEYGVLVPRFTREMFSSSQISYEEQLMADAIKALIYDNEKRNIYIQRSDQLIEKFGKSNALDKWINLIEVN